MSKSYDDGRISVLRRVSLIVRAGELVAELILHQDERTDSTLGEALRLADEAS